MPTVNYLQGIDREHDAKVKLSYKFYFYKRSKHEESFSDVK